ncbi:hypothetical protein [Streptomyces phage phiScoe54]|nr:hypothetical protein [Streptomyces phage phiScoe54]
MCQARISAGFLPAWLAPGLLSAVLRSGHSLHSLAQRCQAESHRRRSEPVSTWSESSYLAAL